MRRRDISKALFATATATASGAVIVAQRAEAQTCTTPCYPQTTAEANAGVTPTNTAIASHAACGEVYPQRYGAQFANTDDTTALQSAFNVATLAECPVVMPGGVALINTTLFFGSNSTTGQSSYPPGLRGAGVETILKATSGFAAGTVLAAKGLSGAYLRDFTVDGSGLATVCIDTSWPNTVGDSAQNTYFNVWVQFFTTNGWLGINDNQSSMKDCTARGAASFGLSGIRFEGSGGSVGPFDNVNCSDSFLSLTAQSATVNCGFFFGVRICESQTGTNIFSFTGTQIYCNPTQNCHFYDSNPAGAGHSISALQADTVYLISNSGANPTNIWNCGLAQKASFNGLGVISQPGYTGTWSLYGAGAVNATSPYPAVIELHGGGINSLAINTPSGFTTKRRDVEIANVGLLDDFPMRVVYRNQQTLSLASGTWTTLVPASAMTEIYASYLVAVAVGVPGRDQLTCLANVGAVSKNGALAASGPIAVPTSANFSNNLTNQIALRYSVTTQIDTVWYAGIDISLNESLPSGSTIYVTLIRVANPWINY